MQSSDETSLPLSRSSVKRQPRGPVVLAILDGVGVGHGDEFDAVATARTPTIDRPCSVGLLRMLRAHGPAVGLVSENEMGNSEIGHNTLGAGRIFDQGANLVDQAIRSGGIWDDEWRCLVGQSARHGSTFHLIGLLSDGNVHSSLTHLDALLDRAARDGVARVRIHVLSDGRDVSDFSALDYVARLEDELIRLRRNSSCDARIASGGGRMTTTMDRYGADWDLFEAGWRAHVFGSARPFASARDAIKTFRRERPGVSDQYLAPFTVVDAAGAPVGPIEDADAVLVFNFRGDRALEISEALTAGERFTHLERGRVPDVAFAAMSQYDTERGFPPHYLVHPLEMAGTISELLAWSGVDQFACAKTQKFGHITYFWNGNRAKQFDPLHETYLEIPSDQVPFQERPEMKAAETAAALLDAIVGGRYGFLRVNFAGGDMVGHTGEIEPTRRAIESIDAALGRIAGPTEQVGGCLVVTADHGNAEDMVQRNPDGSPCLDTDGLAVTKNSHSVNPVWFIVRDFGGRAFRLRGDLPTAGLANVAATLLELLGFVPPQSYELSLLTW